MQRLDNATDQGAYLITVDFFDEAGAPVTPLTATWTLTDGAGVIIPRRENVPITPLSTSTTIALSGNDLIAGQNTTENLRCLVVQATYVSTITGTTLPNNQAVKFLIDDLPAV